jgi:hypothetical protein
MPRRTIDDILDQVRREVLKAQAKHAPMRTFHEGYGVIYEEFMHEAMPEMFRQEVDRPALEKEIVQTAAMAVRFVFDLLKQDE